MNVFLKETCFLIDGGQVSFFMNYDNIAMIDKTKGNYKLYLYGLIFRDESAGEKQRQLIHPGKGFNIAAGVLTMIVCIFLFLPQLAFISLSFMKSFPNDTAFTLEHVADIFANTRGVGLGNYIRNSLVIAGGSALIGMCYAYGKY